MLLKENGIGEVLKAIRNLIEFFKTIFRFIGNFFKSLINFFGLLINIIGKCLTILNSFPSYIKVFGLITLSVIVIYFVVNRTTGKSD